MDPVLVIDFETTGLSPDFGDRATEIAAVLIRVGRILDHHQNLMNAALRVPSSECDRTPIAHHASCDRGFLNAGLARIGLWPPQTFACVRCWRRDWSSGSFPKVNVREALSSMMTRFGVGIHASTD